MSRSSVLKTSTSQTTEPYPWLTAKVYEPKRQRTNELTRQAIDSLVQRNQRVSWSTVVAETKRIDPEGKGLSETGIRENPEAKAYFDRYCSWKGFRSRMAKGKPTGSEAAVVRPIDPSRDTTRVRQRLMRLEKKELVDRLLSLEQTYGEREQQWLSLNDELLAWCLRAEMAEARLQQAADMAGTQPRGKRGR